jgi:peptidoglycan/xylan/chitin deacetylase (PgdA/CDA1 family)
MAELVRWSGAARAPRHSHRLLRADEVARLDRDSLLEVGAHTVSHPMLSRLGAARRHAEIAGSKRRLEELLGRPVASFAYPYGAGVGTARMVRRAGFESACTTAGRRVVPGSDRYRLPRVYVGDWDGDQLERRLAAVG